MPEFLHTPHFVNYIFTIMMSMLISSLAIPSILHVARARHLYDDLGHFRKQHDHGIPRLGGVAIFVSFAITSLIFAITDKSFSISYLLISAIILFAMGLKDDLSGVNSSTKFLIQFIVSLNLVVLGDIRLTSMYGILGVSDLPYFISVTLSILVIMLLINAFNLIDGIDGLAGVTGIVANSAFAALFIYIHHYELAVVSLAIVGAIIGFLRYNITPARIFMGDTGSLLIGLISAVMAIKFIEFNNFTAGSSPVIYAAPAIAVAILIGPIFDTIRVFVIRIINGGSPFEADRNHIHHRMLRLGFTHLQTTLIFALANVFVIGLALLMRSYGNSIIILLIFALSVIFNWAITFFIRSTERNGLALRNLII